MVDQLVQAGVAAELIFAALEKQKKVSATQRNIFQSDYLQAGLESVNKCPVLYNIPALNPLQVFSSLFDTDRNILATRFLYNKAARSAMTTIFLFLALTHSLTHSLTLFYL